MAGDYDKLFSQYSVALARINDLTEQMDSKEKQWDKLNTERKVTDKLLRELCMSILATDTENMKTGKSKPIGSLSNDDILRKAQGTFTSYQKAQHELLKRLLSENRGRGAKIVSLEEQLEAAMRNSKNTPTSREELEKAVENNKIKKQILDNREKAGKNNGERIEIEEAWEEESDVAPDNEKKLYEEVSELNSGAKFTPSPPKMRESRNARKQRRERKQTTMAHMVDLKEYEEMFSQIHWDILQVIGKEGVSVYTEIEKRLFEMNPENTKSGIRSAVQTLTKIRILGKEIISNPLHKKMTLYRLLEMGKRIYVSKYEEMPAVSEMELIEAEHNNANHGYGIKAVGEVFRTKKCFVEVSTFNRKKPIILKSGSSYIPDIVGITENGKKYYFEYECGNTSQNDFNAKCAKMCSVDNTLNFIGPNRSVVDELASQVKRFIHNRGADSLKYVTIRVVSAEQTKDMDPLRDSDYKYVFKPSKHGEEPFVNN